MKMNKRGEKNLSIKSSHNEAKSLPQRALFVNLSKGCHWSEEIWGILFFMSLGRQSNRANRERRTHCNLSRQADEPR